MSGPQFANCLRADNGTKKRPAFTLVELLVVIAIIAVLIALLLPAVQAAREASRNAQCKNNLKQLGLAAQNILSIQRRFPSSGWAYPWVGDPDCGFGLRQPGGWTFSLLPFLEEKAIFNYAKNQGTNKMVAIGRCEGMAASTFFCPSRRPPYLGEKGTSEANDNADKATTDQYGQCRSDYAGNAGCYNGTAFNPPLTTGTCKTWQAAGLGSAGNAATMGWNDGLMLQNFASACDTISSSIPKAFTGETGILYAMSHVGLREITDGTSKTYLIGEKFLPPQWYDKSSTPSGNSSDNGSMYQGHDSDNLRWTGNNADTSPAQTAANNSSPDYTPVHDENDTTGPVNSVDRQRNNFGSAHSSSCNFVMCDGSTQSISYSIDKVVHWGLGNRRDGLNYKVPWAP